jgi:hypothetical protein
VAGRAGDLVEPEQEGLLQGAVNKVKGVLGKS